MVQLGERTMSFLRTRIQIVAGIAAVALILSIFAAFGGVSVFADDYAQMTQRTVLGQVEPAAALGHSLELVRITIAPGTQLVPHRHPGTQIAYIVSGELDYNVIAGSVEIQRAGTDGTPGPIEVINAGESTRLLAGDSIVETETLEHFGANNGPEPVEILISSLFEANQGASIPLTPAATPAA